MDFFNISIFLISNCVNLFFLDFLNKLNFLSKLAKNDVIFIIFNIFIFCANYTISKNNI